MSCGRAPPATSRYGEGCRTHLLDNSRLLNRVTLRCLLAWDRTVGSAPSLLTLSHQSDEQKLLQFSFTVPQRSAAGVLLYHPVRSLDFLIPASASVPGYCACVSPQRQLKFQSSRIPFSWRCQCNSVVSVPALFSYGPLLIISQIICVLFAAKIKYLPVYL